MLGQNTRKILTQCDFRPSPDCRRSGAHKTLRVVIKHRISPVHYGLPFAGAEPGPGLPGSLGLVFSRCRLPSRVPNDDAWALDMARELRTPQCGLRDTGTAWTPPPFATVHVQFRGEMPGALLRSDRPNLAIVIRPSGRRTFQQRKARLSATGAGSDGFANGVVSLLIRRRYDACRRRLAKTRPPTPVKSIAMDAGSGTVLNVSAAEFSVRM